ncbi:hypothetical protein HZ326_19901 [Fusarium oxysporum f. sp. albedinis]|nr:hypothetical protein HZ326_19901 [Fusarium oxysporum f. sp. albedinis]
MITKDYDILIKVYAISINPVNIKKAASIFKIVIKEEFPYKISYNAAGIMVEVGKGVKGLKVGDEVYMRLPESEFAKCPDCYISLKPKDLSLANTILLLLAGNIFYASKVITIVLTSKIPKVLELLIINYTKQKVAKAIPLKLVNFYFNITKDLNILTGYIKSKKIKPVIKAKINIRDIKAIYKAYN